MKRLINSIDLILSLCSLFMAGAIYNPAKISSFARIQRCQRREQQSPTPLNAKSVSPPSWYCQPLSQVPHRLHRTHRITIFLYSYYIFAKSLEAFAEDTACGPDAPHLSASIVCRPLEQREYSELRRYGGKPANSQFTPGERRDMAMGRMGYDRDSPIRCRRRALSPSLSYVCVSAEAVVVGSFRC